MIATSFLKGSRLLLRAKGLVAFAAHSDSGCSWRSLYSACVRGRDPVAPVSGGTHALTKDSSQKKVKDAEAQEKVAHCRRGQM